MNATTSLCTIGGGTGMPIINSALVKGGFKNINSIVTTFDSGGDTGRIRTDERGHVLAFSDYWRSLISLWKDNGQKDIWIDFLKFRDGRNRNFGNIFFQFMSEKVGNLSNVDNLFIRLTGGNLMGRVVPVSEESSNLCFVTKSGKKYRGEHLLDEQRMSADTVLKIWLEPIVKANSEVLEVINNAGAIIICPGSMYGSVITNFLPIGIKRAIKKSKAKIILLTNIMSVRNENHKFTQTDYANVIEKYLGKKLDLIVMADLSVLNPTRLNKALENYSYEHSFPIEYDKNCLRKTIIEDIAVIDEVHNRLRHSEEKVTQLFTKIRL